MKSHPLRVGFDFDGVILYNPLRVIRPLMSYLKLKKVVKRDQLVFFTPHTSWQSAAWWLAHQSSLFPAQGLNKLRPLIASGQIEAHLITGRYPQLAADVHRKLRLFGLTDIFASVNTMPTVQQPHMYKEEMIRLLKLDIFVEDNYDIAAYLTGKSTAELFWVSNALDKHIVFARKFKSVQSVVTELALRVERKLS